ncbi:MAG: TIGR01777 family oxidoreductase [Cyanobacteria bacterium P01_A01_bin.135]
MKVAITGATGFVGSRLVQVLQEGGHDLTVLTRRPEAAADLFPPAEFPRLRIVAYTPLQSGPWQAEIDGCDGVVNLAGAPIAQRWTPEYKQEVVASREQGTQRIVEAIAKTTSRPSVLVNSSAIGYYGTSETATFDEQSPPGDDFLAEVCKRWEAAAQPATDVGCRVVILRTGIVLGNGGALERMIPPFKLFAGGPIGSGKQWFSWIHREDLVGLIVKALTDSTMVGAYNATAPAPVRMQELCQALGQVMARPSWLPVPEFVLELLMGDAAQVVLEGQQVLPRRVRETDFSYHYSTVTKALKDVVA